VFTNKNMMSEIVSKWYNTEDWEIQVWSLIIWSKTIIYSFSRYLKTNIINQIYQPNIINQIFWTKYSEPNILNQIFWTKYSEPNILDQIFWTKYSFLLNNLFSVKHINLIWLSLTHLLRKTCQENSAVNEIKRI